MLAVTGVVTAAAAAVADPAPQNVKSGYDISYPQCGQAYPAGGMFGIVGVNGGVVYGYPCLASELRWARAARNHAPSFYANTADPVPMYSSRWPENQETPKRCKGSNSVACSYDYGWNAANDSFADAVKAERSDGSKSPASAAAAAPWWLDV